MFPKIIARHWGNYQGNAWGYFDDLDKYGCRRYDLTARHKGIAHPGRRWRTSMATSSRRTSPAKAETPA